MSIPDEIREERGASIASMDSIMRSGTATFCVSPSSAASQAVTVAPRRLFPASLRQMGEQLANIGEGSEVHDLRDGPRSHEERRVVDRIC
jgi:hypothetical protein